MARAAPAIDRTVKVLSYLADNPSERFGLSELSRRLELNKATCHAMLAALEFHGFVLRHPSEKTYSLGPAVIALAEAVAPAEHHALEWARAEMARLSDELRLACYATGRMGEEMIVLARRLPPGPYSAPDVGPIQVGLRSPYAPPVGTSFAAWGSPGEAAAWLGRMTSPTEQSRDNFRRVLREVRQRGFDLALSSDVRSQLLPALNMVDVSSLPTAARRAVQEIINGLDYEGTFGKDGGRQPLHSVTAPVFNSAAEPILLLSLDGGHQRLTADEIAAIGNRLLRGVEGITRSIHGRFPADWPSPEQTTRSARSSGRGTVPDRPDGRNRKPSKKSTRAKAPSKS